MKTNLKKKINIVNDVSQLAENSISTTIIDYSKLTSLEIKYIRKSLFEKNIKVKVLKNTLAKKIFQNTNNHVLTDYLIGQTMIVFSEDDISNPMKILSELKKEYTNIKIKSICVYNQLFFEKNMTNLINLPNKTQALSKFVICIKFPLKKIVNNLNYPCVRLLNVLKLINNSKGRLSCL